MTPTTVDSADGHESALLARSARRDR